MRLSDWQPWTSVGAQLRWLIPRSVRPGWEICKWNWWTISLKVLLAAHEPTFMCACSTDAPAITRSKRSLRRSRARCAWLVRATAGWYECCPAPRDFYEFDCGDRHRGLWCGQSEFGKEGV